MAWFGLNGCWRRVCSGRSLLPLVLVGLLSAALGTGTVPSANVTAEGGIEAAAPDSGDQTAGAGPRQGGRSRGERIAAAEAYFLARRAAPGGELPPRALTRAREQLKSGTRSGAIRVAAQGPRATGLVESAWTPIGPRPISGGEGGFGAGPLPNSGRVTALAVQDANTVYLGSAAGGVWKTTDGGRTWAPITEGQPTLATGSITLDPLNPQIVYVGTGEADRAQDSYFGIGILKSTNGGGTWTVLGASTFDRLRVGRIAVDPHNTSLLCAATSVGMARSADAGATWTMTILGTSTNCPCTAIYTGCAVTDVVLDPRTNPSTVYAARGNISGDPSNGVYRSTDAGAAWTLVPGSGSARFPTADVGRINLSVTQGGPAVLFAIVEQVSTNGLLGVWNSANGGATWIQTANPEQSAGVTGASICTQCWYDLGIVAYPSDPNIVYALTTEIYRSTNGGASWTLVSYGYTPPYKIHVDQHALQFIPGNPNAFYAGNDGGIYRSTDAGETYANLNATLSISQFYQGTIDRSNPNVVAGGLQDNGTVYRDASGNWSRIVDGDGGYTIIDPTNPRVIFATADEQILVSANGPDPNAFNLLENGLPGKDVEPRQFIIPLFMDPSDPNTLYTGTTRVYRLTAQNLTWQPISPTLSVTSTGDNAISVIGIAPTNGRVIYAGTGTSSAARSKLWATFDGGATWQDRTGALPNGFVTAIAVSPADPRLAYVTLSGLDIGHVFRTADGGATWTDVSDNLPNTPANAVLIDPADPRVLYVGTDLGVFKSITGGGAWILLNTGMPMVIVEDLQLDSTSTRLYAFTHGRGAYAADRVPAQVTPTPVVPEPAPFALFASGLLLLLGWRLTRRP